MRTTMILLLLICAPLHADEKEALRAYRDLWNSGKRKEACTALGAADTLKATKMLAQISLQHASPKKAETVEQENQRLEVVEGCVAGMAQLRDPKAVAFVFKSAGRSSLQAALRAPFIAALGAMQTQEGADNLVALRKKTRSAPIRIHVALAMQTSQQTSLTKTLLEDLAKSRYWQVKATAIQALAQTPSKKAMPALIKIIGGKNPRLEYEAYQALVELTGQDFGANPKGWTTWWGKNKETWAPPKKDKDQKSGQNKQEPKRSKPSQLWGPTCFGTRFYSQRIIFLVDHTSSMADFRMKNKPTPPDDADEDPKSPTGYDWAGIKTHHEFVKANMVYTIAELDPRTQFNLWFISNGIKMWQKAGLVRATKANKVAAIAAIKKLGAAKQHSDISTPLEQAFAYPGPRIESRLLAGVDTLFVLLDSVPRKGKLNQRNQSDYHIRLTSAAQRWNGIRRVTVHTVGIGSKHPEDLFRLLAATSNGHYRQVGEAGD